MGKRGLGLSCFGVVLALAGACQSGDARCPSESKRVGQKPPEGSEEWCEYSDKDGNKVKHGVYVAWYDKDNKQAEVTYVHGKENGPTTAWYPSGKKMLEGAYKDGDRDGVWTRWYENGDRELETSFGAGQKVGTDRKWDDAGNLIIDLEWKDGGLVKQTIATPTPGG